MILIGTDEAGYGPNLGPLVVTATVWQTASEDMSGLATALADGGLTVADSKKLYHGGDSIAALESVVLAALRTLRVDEPERAPLALTPEKVEEHTKTFQTICARHKTRLVGMMRRVIEAEEFNRLLGRCESKGALLSEATLQLVDVALADCDDRNVLCLCDKHGGRNRYLDLLHAFFPNEMIWVDRESRASSVYRLKRGKQALEFRFAAKGEAYLPIALASMSSKYVREEAMQRFNAFWQSHLPDLKPTAGYPEDARRFRREIADVQRTLGIDDAMIWREK